MMIAIYQRDIRAASGHGVDERADWLVATLHYQSFYRYLKLSSLYLILSLVIYIENDFRIIKPYIYFTSFKFVRPFWFIKKYLRKI